MIRNEYTQAICDSKIETAQNQIRALHNALESRRFLGKKHYLPYENIKFIKMVNMFRKR
jgi:hypothetical protein